MGSSKAIHIHHPKAKPISELGDISVTESFSDPLSLNPPIIVIDIRAFGSWMSASTCPKLLNLDVHPNGRHLPPNGWLTRLRPVILRLKAKILYFGTHLRTPALKTKNFSKNSVVSVKRENGFTKTLLSLFFQGFLSRGRVLVNPFLRFTKTTDFFTKIPGFKGKGS